MVAKVVVTLISLCTCAVSVLAIRQQTIAARAEMTSAAREGRRLDRDLLAERVRIASLLDVDRLQTLAVAIGPLEPAPAWWCQPGTLIPVSDWNPTPRLSREQRIDSQPLPPPDWSLLPTSSPE